MLQLLLYPESDDSAQLSQVMVFRELCFEKESSNFKIFYILFALYYRLRQRNFLHILWRQK